MPEEAKELWKFAPVVLLFFLALWTWYKIMLEKLERICERLERERDNWKELAFTLMARSGIDIPAELLPNSTSFKKEGKR